MKKVSICEYITYKKDSTSYWPTPVMLLLDIFSTQHRTFQCREVLFPWQQEFLSSTFISFYFFTAVFVSLGVQILFYCWHLVGQVNLLTLSTLTVKWVHWQWNEACELSLFHAVVRWFTWKCDHKCHSPVLLSYIVIMFVFDFNLKQKETENCGKPV